MGEVESVELIVTVAAAPLPAHRAKGRALPGVEAIHSVTGAIDMIVRVASAYVDGLEKARAEVAGLAGVAEVSTHVVLERLMD